VSVPYWSVTLSADFWKRAGGPEPFPRSLRESIPWAVPLCVDDVSGLTIRRALLWMHQQGIEWPVEPTDTPLHGVLFAHRGQGFALIEADDEPDERRFTVAHELAHFLRDYLQPRERVVRLFGESSLAVLEGERPPLWNERFHAMLRRIPLGYHTHLLARGPGTDEEQFAEYEADLLAWELLAPIAVVGARSSLEELAPLIYLLQEEFGLPHLQAVRYARHLLPPYRRPLPLLEKWRSG
jgi:IrrE N-terminal-like domain